MRVKTLRGTIAVECHLHAGSKTRTDRVGGPNGGHANEGMKHAHRAQPALQVMEIQEVGKQALGLNGTVNRRASYYHDHARIRESKT
jgi:hypothetical protein